MQVEDLKPRNIKPPLALIPARPLWAIARVFEYGASKYAPWSWANQGKRSDWRETYLSAAMRHLTLAADPHESNIDDESGHSHIAMAAVNCIIALFHELRSEAVSGDGVVGCEAGESSQASADVTKSFDTSKFESILALRVASGAHECIASLFEMYGRNWHIYDSTYVFDCDSICVGNKSFRSLNWQSNEPQLFCDWVNSLTDEQIKALDAKHFGHDR